MIDQTAPAPERLRCARARDGIRALAAHSRVPCRDCTLQALGAHRKVDRLRGHADDVTLHLLAHARGGAFLLRPLRDQLCASASNLISTRLRHVQFVTCRCAPRRAAATPEPRLARCNDRFHHDAYRKAIALRVTDAAESAAQTVRVISSILIKTSVPNASS